MIIIGIGILLFSFPIFVIAWRGRIIARGEFCRKCRFDLAGLDIDSADAKCPECGSEVHDSAHRRGIIRKKSMLGFGIAALLLIVGGGVIGVGASGKTGAVLASMPDSIILRLTDWGIDEALDELVTRSTIVPTAMSANSWDHVIESGLAHQADTSITWDVRWGEVLFQGLVQNQLSDEQLKEYFVNGTRKAIEIRDRASQGSKGVAYTLSLSPGRIEALITGGSTGYMFSMNIIEYGVIGHPASYSRKGAGIYYEIVVPGMAGNRSYAHSGITGSLWNLELLSVARAGEQIPLYVEFLIEIERTKDEVIVAEHRLRFEQSVEILESDVPVVAVYQDVQAAKDVSRKLIISPIYAIAEPGGRNRAKPKALAFQIMCNNVQEALGFSIFIQHDGQEIEVGQFVKSKANNGSIGSINSLRFETNDFYSIESARMFHANAIAAGELDIVLRTQSSVADQSPSIQEVLDISVEFHSVPVQVVDLITFFENDSGVKPVFIP